ncbi:hypothetical protein F5878DRAFT_600961 [Lentinula raphanica]|uniref:Fanconi-associated nuclease n=1 Tax=Lentinula raphanica TaxID=153919 RepID=A0AA38PLP3_9AGAR|nr:hypothetical protein F5878DRAFT_600961 [Lentinula raphanica]
MLNNAASQFVFGSQRIVETADELAILLDGPPTKAVGNEAPRFQSRKQQSPYVSVFEDIVNEIFNYESNLLSNEEREALAAFRKLQYPSRYILIRLALRKPGWHTRKSLSKYVSEVGDCGIALAAKELCIPVSELLNRPDLEDIKVETTQEVKVKAETVTEMTEEVKTVKEEVCEMKFEVKKEIAEVKMERMDFEIIDLTEDSECEVAPQKSKHVFFCEDQTNMTLDEALAKLSLDEVKGLVKDCKVKPNSNSKGGLIQALKRHAQCQGNLSAIFQSQGKQHGLRQTQLNFSSASSSVTQEGRLQRMAVKKLGSCLRVNSDFHELLRRLHIIFYRSTSSPETVFLDSFLTIFKKRTYPSYTSARSTIWPTQEALLLYVEGIDLQTVFDFVLDDTIVKPKGSPPPAGLKTRFRTPITLGPDYTAQDRSEGIVKSEKAYASIQAFDFEEIDVSPIIGPDFIPDEDEDDDRRRAGSEKLVAAAKVVKLYNSVLKSQWEYCVAVAGTKPESERDPGLERFEQGYILARLLWKVAEAHALLHQYEKELEVLRSLLDQRFWRRAKRGKWYERRALVQDRHLPSLYKKRAEQHAWSKQKLDEKKFQLSQELREGLYEAMEDKDTHRVYHKPLVKRLTRVESRLKTSFEDQHTYSVQLKDANAVCIFAYRAENIPRTYERPQPWKSKEQQNVITNWLVRGGFAYTSDESEEVEEPLPNLPSNTGKSVWKSLDGLSTCNVETRALQSYAADENLGRYKGFHSETCILTTIFALLFWDIIFADIPGAFETPYQIAPLDLVEDSFYYARKEMIDTRLKELKDGKALEILRKHDQLYRESKTWCVGVRWDVCEREELAEIVECMGGDALVVICELFCHDYPARASGVPDLILWNYEERKCKFVEVKGPGDRARDNQTLWFDTLLGAGLDVDLCRVLEFNTKNINAEKEKSDQRKAKEEKARIKKEKHGRKKGKKLKKEEWYSDEVDSNVDMLDDDLGCRDSDDYGSPAVVLPSTKRKRRRSSKNDHEDALDSLSAKNSPSAEGWSDIDQHSPKKPRIDGDWERLI